MNIETIIWDLDGTLLDSFHVFTSVMAEMAPTHTYQVPDVAFMKLHYHGSLKDTIGEVLAVKDRTVLDGLVEDFLDFQQKHYEVPDRDLYKDAVSLAKRAHVRGINQVIVSNRDHTGRGVASPRSIVDKSALAPYIDRVVCGDDVTYRKPDARAVESLHGMKPETTLVVGDQFVDGQLAMNLGARAVLVERGGESIPHLEKLGVDWQSHIQIVSSLDEVELS